MATGIDAVARRNRARIDAYNEAHGISHEPGELFMNPLPVDAFDDTFAVDWDEDPDR